MIKKIAITGLTLLAGTVSEMANAQSSTQLDGRVGTITTAVPFLRISPDARAGAMGDAGIATSPDANAQYWNVAKIPMSDQNYGVSATYTPWLRDIVPDVFLGYLSGYFKFGNQKEQAISISMRYFNLGDIDYTDQDGNANGSGKPREYSFDLGYSRKLSNNLSAGVTLRYINSNIASGNVNSNLVYNPAKTFSADAGIFYTKRTMVSEEKGSIFNFGAVVSNIGGKVSYSNERKDFLPANLGIGASYTFLIDSFNKFTVTADLNKLLVPAPIKYIDSAGNEEYSIPTDKGVVSGIFNSFQHAPGLYGTTISVGAEYWYQNQFAGRAGYFYEAAAQGNRKYFTVGAGVRYNVLGIDFSYLIPSGGGTARNPLSNTMRFTLSYNFQKPKSNS